MQRYLHEGLRKFVISRSEWSSNLRKAVFFFQVRAEDKVEFKHRLSIMLDNKPQIPTFK